jgi:hypothetical protein
MAKLLPPYVPPQRALHPIEGKLTELRALDRKHLEEILELTAGGAVIPGATVADHREIRALEMLADVLPPAAKQKKQNSYTDPNSRLSLLVNERAAIERAITIAQQRLEDARRQEVLAFLRTSEPDWNENLRQTALTICSLWKLNRQRETLRKKSGAPSRPGAGTSYRHLLGLGSTGEQQSAAAMAFIEEVVGVGIVTETEIARFMGD